MHNGIQNMRHSEQDSSCSLSHSKSIRYILPWRAGGPLLRDHPLQILLQDFVRREEPHRALGKLFVEGTVQRGVLGDLPSQNAHNRCQDGFIDKCCSLENYTNKILEGQKDVVPETAEENLHAMEGVRQSLSQDIHSIATMNTMIHDASQASLLAQRAMHCLAGPNLIQEILLSVSTEVQGHGGCLESTADVFGPTELQALAPRVKTSIGAFTFRDNFGLLTFVWGRASHAKTAILNSEYPGTLRSVDMDVLAQNAMLIRLLIPAHGGANAVAG